MFHCAYISFDLVTRFHILHLNEYNISLHYFSVLLLMFFHSAVVFFSSFHLPLHVLISQCMFISCCCAMVSPIFPFFSAYHTCYHSENKRRWENLHQFFIVSTSHAHLEKESGEKGVQINLIDVMIKITSVFVVFVWIGRCLSVLATDAILPLDSVDAGNNSAKMRWNARRRKKKSKWKDRKRCWCRPENK